MKLEQQVCSLELAKKLKELGVKQESYAFWITYTRLPPTLSIGTPVTNTEYSAFTVAELGEIMKNLDGMYITSNFDSDEELVWVCQINYWGNERTISHTESAESESDARAKMLIYLMENKII
jgi:hypothetical protein